MANVKRYRFSDGNTFTDDLTLAQAKKFKRLQGGGNISFMPAPQTIGEKHYARKGRSKVKAKMEHLDDSDVATILAALRLFQEEYENKDAVQIADAWPGHFNVQGEREELDVVPKPLGAACIDALCERINCAKCLVLP